MNRPFAIATAVLFAAPVVRAVDFSHDVVPILREHCAACHTGDKKKGGFSMNSRADLMAGGEDGPVVAPGRSTDSKLIAVILSEDPDAQMPPTDAKQKRVPPEKVALLKAWIDDGAKWSDGFTFKKPAYEPPLKPRKVALPASQDGRSNPIDRILDAYLAQHGTPRPEPLDDAAFARRVHLDLIGLLPEPEALEKFLADTAPDKRERLVLSLLGRETDYTEHWLTFWNDLLRNDYSRVGFGPGTGAPVTKWLYDSLMTNKPYDVMVRELIAPPTAESAGFSAGLAWRGTVNASQTREVQFSQSVSQAFLGINMKCASCHDSFIDRWKLTDAYALAAIYATTPLKIARCDKDTGVTAQPGWIFPELGTIQPDAPQPERLKQLATLMTHPENGRLTRTIVNRLWHRLMGRGIVHPVDAMQTEPWSADLLDFLATDFAERGCDVKKTLALICTSQAYQSCAVVRQKDDNTGGYVFTGPRAKRMTAEQFIDAVWQLTGANPVNADAPVLRGKADPLLVRSTQLGAEWIWESEAPAPKKPATPKAAKTSKPATGESPAPKAKSAGRKGDTAGRPAPKPAERARTALRKTFTLAEAPLKAFAVLGQEPTGAQVFVNNVALQPDKGLSSSRGVTVMNLGARLKKGANEIILAVNRPPSGQPAPGVFFELHVALRGGGSENIRTDTTWEWSPNVPNARRKVSGPEVKDPKWLPVVAAREHPRHAALIPVMTAALAHVSTPQPPVRASLMKCDLLQRALGRPNREQIVSMRPEDLTTLEALDLANGAALSNALLTGARRIAARGWESPDALVTWLYRFAIARQPSAGELASARELLTSATGENGVQDLLWAVCMLPEFQLIR